LRAAPPRKGRPAAVNLPSGCNPTFQTVPETESYIFLLTDVHERRRVIARPP
jgi:hypothetical protein